MSKHIPLMYDKVLCKEGHEITCRFDRTEKRRLKTTILEWKINGKPASDHPDVAEMMELCNPSHLSYGSFLTVLSAEIAFINAKGEQVKCV